MEKKGLPPRSGAHWKKGDGEGLQERVTPDVDDFHGENSWNPPILGGMIINS